MTKKIWYRGRHQKKHKQPELDRILYVIAVIGCGAIGNAALILWFMGVV